jgi:aryl carrier-like protein
MISFKHLTAFLWLFISFSAFSQQILPVALATKLDSMTICAGKEKHFGELYLKTTRLVDSYIVSLPGQGKDLMMRMEENFATYFFKAIEANNSGTKIPEVWKNYFNGDHSPLQLKLMGANAHINGDIWQALTNNFSLEEIKQLKTFYKNYNRFIRKEFDELFKSAIRSDKRLHDLNLITLGLDKVYGRMMLKRWRNRQLKLAILKFENPNRFDKKKKRIDKKRNKTDRMIIRRLHVDE